MVRVRWGQGTAAPALPPAIKMSTDQGTDPTPLRALGACCTSLALPCLSPLLPPALCMGRAQHSSGVRSWALLARYNLAGPHLLAGPCAHLPMPQPASLSSRAERPVAVRAAPPGGPRGPAISALAQRSPSASPHTRLCHCNTISVKGTFTHLPPNPGQSPPVILKNPSKLRQSPCPRASPPPWPGGPNLDLRISLGLRFCSALTHSVL